MWGELPITTERDSMHLQSHIALKCRLGAMQAWLHTMQIWTGAMHAGVALSQQDAGLTSIRSPSGSFWRLWDFLLKSPYS